MLFRSIPFLFLFFSSQSPRCPACRLAHIPNLIETRPCLVFRTHIRADSPHFHCPGCVQASLCLYNQDVRPCNDCGCLFPCRAGLIHCFTCRDRRTVIHTPAIFAPSDIVTQTPTIIIPSNTVTQTPTIFTPSNTASFKDHR